MLLLNALDTEPRNMVAKQQQGQNHNRGKRLTPCSIDV